MTHGTQGLQVLTIPEQPRIPIVFADVVDLEGEGDLATLRAGIRLVEQHLLSQPEPPGDAVPTADVGITANGMARAGPAGDER